MQGGDEVVAGAGHAGADGADRAAADGGGVGVGEAEDLGEQEGFAAVGVEGGDELVEGDGVVDAGGVGGLGVLGGGLPVGGVVPGTGPGGADVVDDDAAPRLTTRTGARSRMASLRSGVGVTSRTRTRRVTSMARACQDRHAAQPARCGSVPAAGSGSPSIRAESASRQV